MKRKTNKATFEDVKAADAMVEFAVASEVTFAAGDDDAENVPFEAVAYTGASIPSWAWGNVVLDISGIAATPKDFSVLFAHDPTEIVGQARITAKDGPLAISGAIMPVTNRAREVVALRKAGFNWQVSVSASPTAVERVEEDATAEVNGAAFKGPGTIFRKSRLVEVSFVYAGQDTKTRTKIAAGKPDVLSIEVLEPAGTETGTEETNMAKEKTDAAPEVTLEALRTGYPTLVAEIADEARQAERARIVAIRTLSVNFADMTATADEMVASGKSPEEAAVAFAEIHGKRRSEKVATLDADAPPAVEADEQTDVDATAGEETNLTFEESVKAEWDAKAEVREEFDGDYEAYAAFRKADAEGKVKFLRNAKDAQDK